jgi:hypothetical protein
MGFNTFCHSIQFNVVGLGQASTGFIDFDLETL